MKVAVIFASVEGHTAKIAKTIAKQLEEASVDTELVDLGQPGLSAFGDYDGAILAAPIHVGKYPDTFESFVKDWKSALVGMPTALISVSLSIASPNENEREESEHYPDGLEKRTGWKVDRVHHAAGAIKYAEYDFFKRFMMRRISRLEGGPTDTSVDHEFTDWDALSEFVSGFLFETDLVT